MKKSRKFKLKIRPQNTSHQSVSCTLLTIAALLSLLSLLCTDRVPESIGSYNRFFTFADPEVKEKVKEELEEALEREIITPRTETVFKVRWVDFDSLDRYANRRNLMFLATLNGKGSVSSWVRNSLSPPAKKKVEEDEALIFTKLNLFAQPQTVYFIIGHTPEDLETKIVLNEDYLYSLSDSLINYHLSKWLFKSFFGEEENKELTRQIAREYNFSIRIPPLYKLARKDSNFIWLRRLEPEQWVFVYFEQTEDSTLSYDWWLKKREEVGKLYYEGDVIIDSTVHIKESHIAGYPAMRFSGLWKNPEKILGGPFISYLFYVPKQSRKYIVDCAVFAPTVKKEPYLRHTEIIARTFNPLPKEQRPDSD